MKHGQPRVVVGTAVTASHLPFARTLVDSLRRHHPGLPVTIAAAERETVVRDWSAPDVEVVSIERCGLPDLPWQAFISSPHELTVLAKPLVLSHLVGQGVEAAVYLDADVLVTGDLTDLFAVVARHALTLTPHLLSPASTPDRVHRELTVLRSGTFNGGCVGVGRHTDARRFLDWWLACLRAENRADPAAGYHHDQRWLDLAPAYFAPVGIVRDPGCNVAYWNLHERGLGRQDGAIVLGDGRPCRYVHFSGFDAGVPGVLTRHTSGVTRADLGTAGDLIDEYAARLVESGFDDARQATYSFGAFDNGVPIPAVARLLLRDLPGAAARFPDPFAAGTPGSFFRWLLAPDERLGVGHRVPALWGAVHRLRVDLQQAFPDPAGRDESAFLAWTVAFGQREHGIDARLLPGAGRHGD